MASIPAKNSSRAEHLLNVGRGMAMGAADIVPGVSGGTIALLLGIYERLLGSLRLITDRSLIEALLQRRIRDALGMVPWRFLLALASGILIAALTLARVLASLLVHHPELLWSFFIGLVLASVFVVAGRVPAWNRSRLLSFAAGAIGAFFVVGLVPAQTPNSPLFLFMSGAIAISAMILPGISGAFILVLLGKYQYVLDAVNRGDVFTLAIVAAGAAVGIVTIARLLSWLLDRYHAGTLAFLAGLMLGSLRKLWPWKKTVSWLRKPDGAFVVDDLGNRVATIEANIFPDLTVPGTVEEVIAAFILSLVGFGLVLTINRQASRTG